MGEALLGLGAIAIVLAGTSLFIGCSIAKIPVEKVIRGFLPFYVAMIVMLLLLTFIPELSLGLPRLLNLL
ncbi:TRAP transporter large permease subunit [Clostridiales bacterium COT073_COT-073]|nr:TRAP transporter large permease subunit [Clostridiales bacterium COT073_COT-073]